MPILRKVAVPLVLFAVMPAMIGCGGKRLDQQGVVSAGSVAVVSAVVPRVADISREANRTVLQAAANRLLERALAGLAGVHTWRVVDPVKVKLGKTVQSFDKVSDADLAVLFPAAEERARVSAALQKEVAAWKDGFVAAEGLAVVPYRAFADDDQAAQPEPAVRQVLLQEAARLSAALSVDAVAFVHLRAVISHPRDAYIVTDNRTDGMLQMAATIMVVDKTGKVIIDHGWPKLDETARTKDLLPLYRGAGKDSVKDENIDLGDSRKKIAQAFTTMTDDAVADLMAELKAAAGKQ